MTRKSVILWPKRCSKTLCNISVFCSHLLCNSFFILPPQNISYETSEQIFSSNFRKGHLSKKLFLWVDLRQNESHGTALCVLISNSGLHSKNAASKRQLACYLKKWQFGTVDCARKWKHLLEHCIELDVHHTHCASQGHIFLKETEGEKKKKKKISLLYLSWPSELLANLAAR